MYEFLYDLIKPKYGEETKLFYLDRDSFIVYIKTDIIKEGITENIEAKFDTSNYELDRPLLEWRKKKLLGIMQDELGEKIMTKFVVLRAKTCNYLIYDGSENNKAKGTRKFVIKKLKF